MLRFRLLFAGLILAPLVGLLFVDFFFSGAAPGIWLVPLALAIGLMAAAEVLDLLRHGGHSPASWPVFAGVALIIGSACSPLAWGLMGEEYPPDCPLGKLGWPLCAAAVAVALAFLGEMRRYEKPGGVIVNVALATFAIFYVGLLFTFLVELRFFHSNEWGMAALVSVIFVVKFSDTGAYTLGRLFGRHKLAPRLSPGKTVEGAIGGIAVACVASVTFFYFLAPVIVGNSDTNPTWWGCVVYGLVVALAGILGDLAESLLKRDMDRKDSSSWLPGLGGILDIVDSVLMAAPAAFFCWVLGIVGPG